MKPKVMILRGPGTNCDMETANSFNYVGGKCELTYINDIVSGKTDPFDYDIMVFPGGFSYGDYVSAGKIFGVKIRKVMASFKKFMDSGRPVLGICNGFQILVKTGLLPENGDLRQSATLADNDCGRFVCAHARLSVNAKSPCIFTKNLPKEIILPVAHGEGKFVAEKKVLEDIMENDLNALSYKENVNGSLFSIAGITNRRGNCLGLMPHPERNFLSCQNAGRKGTGQTKETGWTMFKNAVDYVR